MLLIFHKFAGKLFVRKFILKKNTEVEAMKMKISTENMAKIGGAVMAVGTAAAIAGIATSKKSTKSKMKKLAKKSIKVMDNIVGSVNSMMK